MIKTASNGGVDIAYEEFGRPGGEPLLLIMGLSFQMIWWPDEFCEMLAERGFHVVRFDNRDSGLSTRCDGGKYTAQDMTADALALMDDLGWDSAHVVGASLGANLAQLVAIEGRARSLTCIMGGGVAYGGLLNTLRVMRFGALMRLMVQRFPDTPEGAARSQIAVIKAMSSPHHPFDTEWVTRTAQVAAERGIDQKATMRQFAAGRTAGNLTKKLRDLALPTLVIHGEDDPLIRTAASRDVAAAIPGARLIVYPAMGHEIPRYLYTSIVDEIQKISR
jgi:pimeloyl-ACP methyl ester carboxylesterase